ncbi:MAG: cell fate regulator YaaT (PSP1 superfamily) [Desulforhopalus sp.]|jgi:cell fate regulator YaaT (PSP1 superfamily)
MAETEKKESSEERTQSEQLFYRIRFRDDGQHFTASYLASRLIVGTVVLVQTDHGVEPAKIAGDSPMCGCKTEQSRGTYVIKRVAQENELEKFRTLAISEDRAFKSCNDLIKKHKLNMHLVRVERYFNGSKMVFYFTADSRVDFRALVKDLVQEFRTRVEMRQVGVRHETKMIGGVGTCGRELCCSSFIKKFDSVSIKMAKEQDLPLNPTKISGVCNRLLCCLTYEYDTYKKQRKSMPKLGKRINIDGEIYLVRRQIILKDAILAENSSGEEVTLLEEQWRSFQPVKRPSTERKKDKKSSGE